MDKDTKHLDQTLLMALSSIGDTDSAVELGHFGNMTRQEAIVRLKNVRKALKTGHLIIKRKPGISKT